MDKAKAKKALKEAIRDKMQGHILEAIGCKSLNSKDLRGASSKVPNTPRRAGLIKS